MVDPRPFDWGRHPDAERFLEDKVESFLKANTWARDFARTLREKTSTLFFHWIDHVVLPYSNDNCVCLTKIGFSEHPLCETSPGRRAYFHPGAVFPSVLLEEGANPGRSVLEVALKPESVVDFAARQGIKNPIEGAPFSRFRKVLVSEENGTSLWAVERRGYGGYIPETPGSHYYKGYHHAQELWLTRPRAFASDEEGFRRSEEIVDRLIAQLGRDPACYIIFEGEREYWLHRNRAARVQKMRQDALGLGWGNHDHHTFRCSRRHLQDLIRILEKLGFQCRERFYAGQEAGWGAQVLEHPVLDIAIFADLDLAPEETETDFAHNPLPMRKELGTVGLWVGLHGESFLQAGMHHLACRFHFELLREDLARLGIYTMNPFSWFDFLKQAFTEAEVWKVIPERARFLLGQGSITEEQYRRFLAEGARGSHLENLQRREGFKGFNQRSVSAIIKATDPRR